MLSEPYVKTKVEKGEHITCDGCDKELKEGDTFYALKHTGNYCTKQCMMESNR